VVGLHTPQDFNTLWSAQSPGDRFRFSPLDWMKVFASALTPAVDISCRHQMKTWKYTESINKVIHGAGCAIAYFNWRQIVCFPFFLADSRNSFSTLLGRICTKLTDSSADYFAGEMISIVLIANPVTALDGSVCFDTDHN
jgi:hypothetical protein